MPATNHVSATLTDADVQAVLDAIATINTKLPFLHGLTDEEKVSLPKMGAKSLFFVSRALEVARANPTALPSSMDITEFAHDLALWRQLDRIATPLTQLNTLFSDTRIALGSDLYTSGLAAYGYLKAAGSASGLDDVRDALSQRFVRRSVGKAPTTTAAPSSGTTSG